jgi:hypothetical protein
MVTDRKTSAEEKQLSQASSLTTPQLCLYAETSGLDVLSTTSLIYICFPCVFGPLFCPRLLLYPIWLSSWEANTLASSMNHFRPPAVPLASVDNLVSTNERTERFRVT